MKKRIILYALSILVGDIWGASRATSSTTGAPAAKKMISDEQALTTIKRNLAAGRSVDNPDKYRETVLHKESRNGHLRSVAYLIEHGANLNARNIYGKTALNMLAGRLRDEPAGDLVKTYYKIGKMLIKAGADTNLADDNGDTPLHTIMGKYRPSAPPGQAGQKIKREQKEEVVRVPTDLARQLKREDAYFSKFIKFITLLVCNGADLNAQNNQGVTPLHRAAREGSVWAGRLLLRTVWHLCRQDNAEVNVNIKDDQGKTPLHWAALKGHYLLVESILKYGGETDVNLPDNRGRTPLQWVLRQRGKGAVFYGAGYHMPANNAYDIIKLLLSYDADPRLKDNDGKSALDWSIAKPLSDPIEAKREQDLLASEEDHMSCPIYY